MVEHGETGSASSSQVKATAQGTSSDPLFRSFLIADIRGWTNFTRERGPAAAGRLAQTFADLARDAVEARGGEVFELRGDEVVAVFDRSAQAVRAAVELQETLAEVIAGDPTLPLLAGIGLDAGDVVPVEEGFRGSPLNMAARLCSNAAAGQVLVSPAVARDIGHIEDFVIEDRGTATLKGFDGPTPFFEVRAVPPEREVLVLIDEQQDQSRLELSTDMALVGREHEMRWARGTWRQVRRGHGRVVCVSGPSQIGKTRLAAEIAAHVEGSGGSVWYTGAGGTALADALAAVHAALSAARPTLVILDDVDAVGSDAAAEVADRLEAIEARPALVLLLAQDPQSSPALSELVERHDVGSDGHRRLSPLDQEGVREIGRAYVGDDIELAPLEAFFRSSGGVPGRVHEVVGAWAREEATRRLSAAAQWLVAGRNRRASDLEFANNVLGLKLDRLFQVPDVTLEERINVCPYKGLAAFKGEDAAMFFGRERLVGELAARSVDVGLLGVIGASGSGKSSAVAAGLIPSLAAGLLPGSDRWRQLSMRPGEHPMDELGRTLGEASELVLAGIDVGDANERLVLVIDQFEEVFTACADDAERAAFVEAVTGMALAAPDGVVVTAILRADFYGRCAEYPDLARLLGENHVLVGPMSKDELHRAIELPARRVGLQVESVLIEQLVEDVIEEPGGLPLLSTALVEIWQQREGRWLRAETYDRTGGVRGAVARLAESTFAQLTEEQKEATPGVLLRLVGPGEGDSVTRRRVPMSEFDLGDSTTTAAVIDRFTVDRLLTTSDGTIEVAHEALLREWPRLQTWLAEDAQGRELRTHLATASRTWEDAGEDDSELYRGPRLSATLDWASSHDRQLNDLEWRFLTAGRQAGEREVERQRRSNRRLRGLLVGVAILLVASLVAGSVALVQRSRARGANLSATAQRLGAQALQQDDLDLKLLLARQAVALYDSPATDRNAALLSSPAAIKVLHPLQGLLGPIVLSYDGSLFALGNFRGDGAVVDAFTYQTVASFPGQPLSFSTDGRVFVDIPGPGTIIVDPTTGARQDLGKAYVDHPSASWINPDFSELATVGADHSTVTFWNTDTLAQSGQIHARSGNIVWFDAYSYDGRYFITVEQSADQSGPLNVVLRDAVSHRLETTVTAPADLSSYDMSRDGKWFVFGSQDGSVSVVNVSTGHKLVMTGRHDGPVDSVAISSDDTTVVSGGLRDNAVKVWDLRSGELSESLSGQTHAVSGLAISPEGRTLYSSSLDGSVIVWDLQGSRRLGRWFSASAGSFSPENVGYPPVPHLLAMSRTGGLFATASCDGTVVIGDVATLQKISVIRAVRPAGACDPSGTPYNAVFTPDGERVVVGGPDGQVTMFDARSGKPMPPAFSGPKKTIVDTDNGRVSNSVEAVAVSPDGKIVAAGTAEGSVYLWDAATGASIQAPMQVPDSYLDATPSARNWVFDIAFNSDGTRLVAAHGSEASVWSTSDWSLMYSVNVDDSAGAAYSAAFSPDGRTLATAGGITDLRLWDAATGSEIASIPVDTTYTVSLGWSPDSSTIATGGWDGSIKLVDLASRSVVGALPGPTLLFNNVAFTPDGSAVLVIYENGRGLRWTFDPAAWAQRACDVAGRTLTQDEWNRFLPALPYDPACTSATSG